MKKLIAMLIAFVLVFAGCSQVPQSGSTENLTDSVPYDYEGVWLRTGVYVNGALDNQTPATLTLNRANYTSVGTCMNTGRVISEGEGAMTMTIDSTNCEGISAGGEVSNTYSIQFDKDRDIETMTIVTGPVMETYDRQS